MPRLIIEYPANLPLSIVLSRIAIALLTAPKEIYGVVPNCWSMAFKDGIQVVKRQKRKPTSADSLVLVVPESYNLPTAKTPEGSKCRQNTNSTSSNGRTVNDVVYAEQGTEWYSPEGLSPPKLYS